MLGFEDVPVGSREDHKEEDEGNGASPNARLDGEGATASKLASRLLPSPPPSPRRVRLDVRVVQLESLGFDDCVKLVYAADVLVASQRSDAAMSFWMRGRGTHLIELLPFGVASDEIAATTAAAGVGH